MAISDNSHKCSDHLAVYNSISLILIYSNSK